MLKLLIIHFLIYIPFLNDLRGLCWVSRLIYSHVCTSLKYNPGFVLKTKHLKYVLFCCFPTCCSCCYLGLITIHRQNYKLLSSIQHGQTCFILSYYYSQSQGSQISTPYFYLFFYCVCIHLFLLVLFCLLCPPFLFYSSCKSPCNFSF